MATALAHEPADPVVLQRYARYAGVAMLLTIIFGFLGEMILPNRIIVAGDAAATAANITGHPTLFRVTFASYLVEGICDVALCVFWYILLKPVDRNLALLSAFMGMTSMITFAVGQASFFASSVILREAGGMTSFPADQRQALAMLAVRFAGTIAYLFICFYGIASMLRGYLIARSGYFPRILGILLFIGGAGFFLRSITYILVPQYSSFVMLLPMMVAGIPLMGWLLIKGVNTEKLRT
jgi:hypothetical protein